MIIRQRLAIHFERKHILRSHRVVDRQAACECLLDFGLANRLGLDIGSEEHDFLSAVLNARFL